MYYVVMKNKNYNIAFKNMNINAEVSNCTQVIADGYTAYLIEFKINGDSMMDDLIKLFPDNTNFSRLLVNPLDDMEGIVNRVKTLQRVRENSINNIDYSKSIRMYNTYFEL